MLVLFFYVCRELNKNGFEFCQCCLELFSKKNAGKKKEESHNDVAVNGHTLSLSNKKRTDCIRQNGPFKCSRI